METVKFTVLQGCLAGLIISVIASIVPEEKFSSQLKVIFSAFFILAVFSALKNELPEILSGGEPDIYTEEYSSIEAAAREEMKIYIKKNTEQALKELLTEEGIETDIIEAEINVDEEYKVTLVSVIISTSNRPAAEKILRAELGNETAITVISTEPG